MSKVNVPEGMLKAAMGAIAPSALCGTMSKALEAALGYQRDNPRVPTDEQFRSRFTAYSPAVARDVIRWWFAVAYCEPEPPPSEWRQM